MKLLWTISNWKRTGPVEPSLDLAAAVRDAGHDVRVAVGAAPGGFDDHARASADARGLIQADTGARLAKHASPLRDLRDAGRLRRWIQREQPDAVVATLRNDHVLAMRAARGSGTPVARLWFGDGTGPLDHRDKQALRGSAIVMAFSERARRHVESAGVRGPRFIESGPPLALKALRERGDDPAGVRARWSISPDRLLVGIVARLQRHRRFELLWDAVSRLAREGVPCHVLVIGRGTYEETVGREPVRRLGLEGVVTFAGYLRGRDYATSLAALDAQLFLVPGSDATCRALREGMALGVPSVATRRGMLPELVVDGETGLLVDEDAQAWADALTRLARDPEATAAMGRAARARADAHFSADVAAARLLAALESVPR